MGTKLPFLPFATEEENKLFAECVLRSDFPTMNDEDEAAVSWCKFVDGVTIFPKLPVHIRVHRDSFERNQRVKDCVRKARKGKELLNELLAGNVGEMSRHFSDMSCPPLIWAIYPQFRVIFRRMSL